MPSDAPFNDCLYADGTTLVPSLFWKFKVVLAQVGKGLCVGDNFRLELINNFKVTHANFSQLMDHS